MQMRVGGSVKTRRRQLCFDGPTHPHSEKGKTFQLTHFCLLDPRRIHAGNSITPSQAIPKKQIKKIMFLALAIIHIHKQVHSSH